jgi:hypothetical protein
MFSIPFNDSIISHCDKLGDTYQFGNTHKQNHMATDRQKKIGLRVQGHIMDMACPNSYLSLIDGYDGGSDIYMYGQKIDVKAMGRKAPMLSHYCHNFNAYQKDIPTNIYLFCCLYEDKKEILICGWCDKDQLLSLSTFHKQGSMLCRSDGHKEPRKYDMYEIEHNKINDLTSWSQFKKDMWTYRLSRNK